MTRTPLEDAPEDTHKQTEKNTGYVKNVIFFFKERKEINKKNQYTRKYIRFNLARR